MQFIRKQPAQDKDFRHQNKMNTPPTQTSWHLWFDNFCQDVWETVRTFVVRWFEKVVYAWICSKFSSPLSCVSFFTNSTILNGQWIIANDDILIRMIFYSLNKCEFGNMRSSLGIENMYVLGILVWDHFFAF